MSTKRIKNCWKALCSDEGGDGALGSVISMGMFMMLLVLFVWMILTYYSFRVLSSAANEGAAIAARYDSTPNQGDSRQAGRDHAEDLIEMAGARSLVENVTTEAPPPEGNRVTVVVTGKAVTPLFAMNLSATGSAPIEEFRPQGEEVAVP